MPPANLSASVGKGGVNQHNDVVLVQKLLIARGYVSIGSASGICDTATLGAIREFQSAFMRNPDGRVDVNGNSWRFLAAVFGSPGATAAAPAERQPLTRPLPRPAAGTINTGLAAVSNDYMLQTFGQPLVGGGYTSLCQQPNNVRLRRNIVTDSVGPFRVTGLWPAVLSLKDVMAGIAREQPAVYAELGSAGMLSHQAEEESVCHAVAARSRLRSRAPDVDRLRQQAEPVACTHGYCHRRDQPAKQFQRQVTTKAIVHRLIPSGAASLPTVSGTRSTAFKGRSDRPSAPP
jgi:hypothetical protein